MTIRVLWEGAPTMTATSIFSATRITGVDAARGVALLGMISVHLMPLTQLGEDGSTLEPTVVGRLFAGTASALFAVVAGISLSLFSSSRSPADARRSIGLRALILVFLGLACGHLDTSIAIILCHYGLLFLAASAFITVSTRRLGVVAGAWLLISPLAAAGLARFMQAQLGVSEYVDSWRLWHTPNFGDLLLQPGLLLWDLLFTGYYPVLQWTGYLLLGLALGRLRLGRLRTGTALAFGGGLAALASGWVSAVLFRSTALRDQVVSRTGVEPEALDAALQTGSGMIDEYTVGAASWFAAATPHSGAPLDLVRSAGAAVAIVGICLVATTVARGVLRWPLLPLIGAGALPLTLYVGHLVGLHLFSDATDTWSEARVTAVYLLAALAVGLVFALVRRRGPLEWMLHELTSAGASSARR